MRSLAHGKERKHNQAQAPQGKPLPCSTFARQTTFPATENSQEAACQQFPGPSRQKIKARHRLSLHQRNAGDKTKAGQASQNDRLTLARILVQQDKQQRKENIKLFFNRKRPIMQVRLAVRREFEIISLPDEGQVGDGKSCSYEAGTCTCKILGRIGQSRSHQGGDGHGEKGRKNSRNSPLVKLCQGE